MPLYTRSRLLAEWQGNWGIRGYANSRIASVMGVASWLGCGYTSGIRHIRHHSLQVGKSYSDPIDHWSHHCADCSKWIIYMVGNWHEGNQSTRHTFNSSHRKIVWRVDRRVWRCCDGNWTTRGLPTCGLDISQTGQLAH